MWIGRERGVNTHVDGQSKGGRHTCGWAGEGGQTHMWMGRGRGTLTCGCKHMGIQEHWGEQGCNCNMNYIHSTEQVTYSWRMCIHTITRQAIVVEMCMAAGNAVIWWQCTKDIVSDMHRQKLEQFPSNSLRS